MIECLSMCARTERNTIENASATMPCRFISWSIISGRNIAKRADARLSEREADGRKGALPKLKRKASPVARNGPKNRVAVRL